MEEKYVYNEDTLSFEKVVIPKIERRIPGWSFSYLNLIVSTIFLINGLCFGFLIGNSNGEGETKDIITDPNITKHDLVIGSNGWKDSVFTEYENKANQYLSREKFNGTPIKGGLLALAAENAYDSTGILLPVELCLAQCQWESGMGLKGRSPINNPFNIGENDSGTVMWFDDTFDGVQSYFYYMCSNYLKCKSINELFNNFVNCNGKRYASGDYESHVPNQYHYIVQWLEKN
jgi:hypothetical protein